MASGSKGFGDWFKDVQAGDRAAAPATASAPAASSSGGWFSWGGGGSQPPPEDVQDPEEAASLLPSFLRGGKKAAPPPADPDWTCGLSRTQRLQVFVVAAAAGVFLMALALFVFLPMILFVPSKFALSFTIGSVMFLMAFAFLRGPKTFITAQFARDRILFTSAYLGSLFLTLYAALELQSYIMVMVSSGVQVGALVTLAVSYIPGGTSGLQFFSRMVCSNIVYPALRAFTSCFSRS